MPSATEKPEENAMASTDVIVPGAADDDRGSSSGGEPPRSQPTPTSGSGRGFFHIYKSGAGYWTRMCTAAGAALIMLLTAYTLYTELPNRIDSLFLPGNFDALRA